MQKTLQIDRESHARVKYLLSLKGATFSDVAQSLSLTVSSVCSASLGRHRSAKVEQEISKRTGVPVSELWPGRTNNFSQEAAE
jgi:lambda repressor-like predicted transcriptional regulator